MTHNTIGATKICRDRRPDNPKSVDTSVKAPPLYFWEMFLFCLSWFSFFVSFFSLLYLPLGAFFRLRGARSCFFRFFMSGGARVMVWSDCIWVGRCRDWGVAARKDRREAIA